MTYEQTVQELEKIIDKLSNDKLAMEESLTLYKKGIELAQKALKELDRFQSSIEVLNKDLSEMQIAMESEENTDDGDDDTCDDDDD